MKAFIKNIICFGMMAAVMFNCFTVSSLALNEKYLFQNSLAENVSKYPYHISAVAVWPVRSGGNITSDFGNRINPITEREDFHTGVDIASFRGDDIVAAYGGKVINVFNDEIYGKCIEIGHSGGVSTFYAHCDEIVVNVETVVRRGETIGKQGSTGWATGPHLHFEIRIDSDRVDPLVSLQECRYGV